MTDCPVCSHRPSVHRLDGDCSQCGRNCYTRTQTRHFLLPKSINSIHAATQCGQRQHQDMATTKVWDNVDCHRCWYYRALEIATAAGLKGTI